MPNFAKYFFRGLLVLIPIVATVYVVMIIFQKLNDLVFHPIGDSLISGDRGAWLVTLMGFVATLGVIVIAGVLASNLIGRTLVSMFERWLKKVPLLKLLYSSVKDLLSAFVGEKRSFTRPVLVALTEDGPAKVIGFVTQDSLEFLGLKDHVSVYLPQSYNFAGNLMVFPADRVQALEADSSDVMTFLVSGGVSGESGPVAQVE